MDKLAHEFYEFRVLQVLFNDIDNRAADNHTISSRLD
jgi:hypothetical protein